MNKIPISVIILTFNEEKNITACLDSIGHHFEKVFMVDSGSNDDTLNIVKNYPVEVIQHPFENYSKQRNWAFKNLPIQTEWILNMDADHRLTPEIITELAFQFKQGISQSINGMLASRKTLFMGKWIKYGGHYPTYHAVIFRNGKGFCEDKLYDQHFKVDGEVLKLNGDIIDLITESLSTFTLRHDKWSGLEALEQFEKQKINDATIKGSLTSKNPIAKRRYIKNIYERFPLFVRPALYFFIRYFLRLGFLDGRRGLIFHFLQCFWFRFLIDAKIYELRKTRNENK
ncbi:glycosyltransferase family 2 protein [Pedobacter sp. SD-b]|uniref:Glycosyltransferase family 2 protein n=1 Tax=Pedobacter segetis TaxID=2793069 RepID=A0ABS1BGQ8_9SPHI|nr:glycosyltransferase family 2 protein [Pedobacter segetis]MBK0382054.1 glycosyltransferase family 2 protein [Pedobacter segetis]